MRWLRFITLCLPPLLAACADQNQWQRFQYSQRHMGVRTTLAVYGRSEDRARRAADRAFAIIGHLDRVMSDYRPDSELSRLCDAADALPRPVSRDLYRVLEDAVGFARLSGGAFDPTVGPVVALWRDAVKTGRKPTDEAIRAAGSRVGFERIRLVPDARAVALEPGTRLDLGGIAKGYAADRALESLRRAGLPRALVDVGGEIAAGEPPPDRNGWSVAVGGPDPSGVGLSQTVTITNAALATSGDLFQFVEIDGVRYSHIVNPATGLGLTSRLLVTVRAPEATTADAVASAVSVLGIADGLKLVDGLPGVEVRIADLSGGAVRITRSEGFPPDLTDPASAPAPSGSRISPPSAVPRAGAR